MKFFKSIVEFVKFKCWLLRKCNWRSHHWRGLHHLLGFVQIPGCILQHTHTRTCTGLLYSPKNVADLNKCHCIYWKQKLYQIYKLFVNQDKNVLDRFRQNTKRDSWFILDRELISEWKTAIGMQQSKQYWAKSIKHLELLTIIQRLHVMA